jgi:membrane-anchored glycerophosphoryl diester phosphodiesterase (GDPDase)
LFGFFVIGRLSFFFAVPFIILGLLLVNAIKNALTCRWLPEIVAGKKPVFVALTASVKYGAKNMPKLMGGFFAIRLIMLVMHAIIALLTFGFGLLITIAFESVLVRSLELVIYHKDENIKFYTENQDFTPKENEVEEEGEI